jgi:uncharacterized membrane protein
MIARKRTTAEVARTRAYWLANKPGETAAPAYVPDPPVVWHVALALVVILLAQAAFAPYLSFRGATISFVTLLVAWYAVRTGSLRGLLFGLIAGSCEDALAGSSGVAWTFATGLAGLVAGRLSRTWLADTKLALVPGAAAITLLRDLAFATFMQMQGRPLALPLAHLHAALWQSALDALAAFAALRIGPELGGRLANRR